MTAPRASVIVCTRNRARSLEGALTSVVTDGSRVEREVVVVDNGSSDATRSVVERLRRRGPLPVRYVLEPAPGLSGARNAGVAEARGDLLLFTDDDVEVGRGWADALAAGFAEPDVVAVGGRVLPRWPFPPPAWLDGPHAVHLTLRDLGPDQRRLGERELPVGANMALRRAALERLGPEPFPASLGYSDGRPRGGEEWYVLERVRELGAIAYRPDALVHHLIAPERIDWGSLRSAWFHGGVATGRLERLRGEPLPTLPRRLVRAARTYRRAVAARRSNESSVPTADRAWNEFYAYMRAGWHLDVLLGRFPRLADGVAGALERIEARRA